jgi:hypothetical protein
MVVSFMSWLLYLEGMASVTHRIEGWVGQNIEFVHILSNSLLINYSTI